jgi:sulfofructose kinase
LVLRIYLFRIWFFEFNSFGFRIWFFGFISAMTSPRPETVEQLDVLAMGCVAVDDFLYVPEYPAAETKVRVTRGQQRCGGLAGGALQAAARLGARAGYAATLGDDELSRFVANRFQAEGISLTYLRRVPGVRPIHSTVIVDTTQHTRTVLFSLDGAQGAQEDWPPQPAIEASKVLFVDHYGIEGMTRAAKIARAAGIPIVADFERNEWPGFDDLLTLVDHLIVSEAFASKLTGEASPDRACSRLHAGRPGTTVIVTCGSEGCWFCADASAAATHYPAFPVDVKDSTGCGDVFHGAYAVGLAKGKPLPERVRFASAAAALKAANADFPTGEEVEAFERRASRR